MRSGVSGSRGRRGFVDARAAAVAGAFRSPARARLVRTRTPACAPSPYRAQGRHRRRCTSRSGLPRWNRRRPASPASPGPDCWSRGQPETRCPSDPGRRSSARRTRSRARPPVSTPGRRHGFVRPSSPGIRIPPVPRLPAAPRHAPDGTSRGFRAALPTPGTRARREPFRLRKQPAPQHPSPFLHGLSKLAAVPRKLSARGLRKPLFLIGRRTTLSATTSAYGSSSGDPHLEAAAFQQVSGFRRLTNDAGKADDRVAPRICEQLSLDTFRPVIQPETCPFSRRSHRGRAVRTRQLATLSIIVGRGSEASKCRRAASM